MLMIFCFFNEASIFGIVSICKFFVTGFPDTIEDCSCKAVDGEYFAAAIAEVDEYEHIRKYKFK